MSRTKGARNKSSEQKLAIIERKGITPLQYMLDVMRNSNLELDIRLDAAKSAAQYIHPRLTAIAHSGAIETTKADDLTDALLAHIASRGSDRTTEETPSQEVPSELH